MPTWRDDEELFSLVQRELYSAVVGDVMDRSGLHLQFLPPEIRPLRSDMVLVGRAMPVLEVDSADQKVAQQTQEKPSGLMLEALDDLKRGEVYICAGPSPRYALWGELMSTRAMKLGASGVVLDGYHRDTVGILRLEFPTFSYGSYAQDQSVRGRVIDFRCPITFRNGVQVETGYLVFGDVDGVVVVPKEHEGEVIHAALEKVRGENTVRKAIEGGMSAAEAWERYGVM